MHGLAPWEITLLSAQPKRLYCLPGGVLDSAASVNMLPPLLCEKIELMSSTVVAVLYKVLHHCTLNEIWRNCKYLCKQTTFNRSEIVDIDHKKWGAENGDLHESQMYACRYLM